jgi:hypothetical protein
MRSDWRYRQRSAMSFNANCLIGESLHKGDLPAGLPHALTTTPSKAARRGARAYHV